MELSFISGTLQERSIPRRASTVYTSGNLHCKDLKYELLLWKVQTVSQFLSAGLCPCVRARSAFFSFFVKSSFVCITLLHKFINALEKTTEIR